MSDEVTIEGRLADLEAASADRDARLRALLSEMPAAVSRRGLLADAARELRAAPNKGDIARAGVRKATRIPGAAARRIVRRSTRRN